MYELNRKAPKYMSGEGDRTEWRNRQIHYYIGEITIPLPVINSSSRQKIKKNIDELDSSINQFDLIDINRIIYPTNSKMHILLKLTVNVTKVLGQNVLSSNFNRLDSATHPNMSIKE
jgi:hypothetical protein